MMKKLLLLALLSLPLVAQDAPACKKLVPAEKIKAYDTDGDGKLSGDERKAMRQANPEMRGKRGKAKCGKGKRFQKLDATCPVPKAQ